MSEDPNISSSAKRATRIITLGGRGAISNVIETIQSSPMGAAFTWAKLGDPDRDLANFVQAAAEADVAVIGFETGAKAIAQLQRWVWLASELGIPHVVVTVDSADLPPQGRKGFDALTAPVVFFARERGKFQSFTTLPINPTTGGNIVERDTHVGWYMGPTLLDHLIKCGEHHSDRADHQPVPEPISTDHIQARIFWIGDDPLLPWRPLQIKTNHGTFDATVTAVKYERDAHADQRIKRNRLLAGDIGVCNINTPEPIAVTSFEDDRQAGLISLIDPATGIVVALGLIDYSLRRASNVRWQETTIAPEDRAQQKQQKASVLWFTGLSGAGKSTIADLVEKRLNAAGKHTMLLDGDNVRHGLNKDLGFTDVDRVENIRRISEVSKLMCDAGLIVLVSFISPFRAERQLARETVASHDFYEIYVATPLEVAEARDVKGLYAKARRGEIKNFTGIDSPYEPPEKPELTVETTNETADQAAERIVTELLKL